MLRKKLYEIADIRAGGTPSRNNPDYWNGNIPWVKISNINGKYVTTYDETITELGLKNSSAKLFEKETILYTIFATLGRVGILQFDATTNQAIAGIKIKDNSISTDYLYYYLRSLESYVKDIGNGAAQQNINQTILKNFAVPVISKEKQNQICSKLENIENVLLKKQHDLASLDELIKSRFIEMFGEPKTNPYQFPMISLSNVFDIGSSKRVYESEWTSFGVPFYRAREIVSLSKNGFVDNALFITEEMYQQYKGKYGVPKENDMMVTGVGTLGVCYIVKPNDKFYFKDGNTLWFKNKGLCNVRFIKELFDTDLVKEQISANANASTVGTYTITKANNTIIIYPPIELQNEFAEFVKLIDKSKFIVQKEIKDLQELLDKKMDEYFGQ